MMRSVVQAALLVAAIAGGAIAAAPSHEERVVRITAKKFEFDPPRIVLKRGEKAALELVSADRIHGFKLPALGIRADVEPGQVGVVHLLPNVTGTYAFACDSFCGAGHDDMEGEIVVTE